MINNTRIRIAKKYEGVIAQVYNDGESYWVELEDGYIFESMECGSQSFDTQKEVLEGIKDIIKGEEELSIQEAELAMIEELPKDEMVVEEVNSEETVSVDGLDVVEEVKESLKTLVGYNRKQIKRALDTAKQELHYLYVDKHRGNITEEQFNFGLRGLEMIIAVLEEVRYNKRDIREFL